LTVRQVSGVAAVGRERGSRDNRERIFAWKIAIDGDRKELLIESIRTGTRGEKQNAFTIGCPTNHLIVAGMIGEAFGDATGSGNYVDVRIAVILASERNPVAVGGEGGVVLGANAGGEPARISAIAADDPKIPTVAKDDLGLAECRLAEKQRWIGLAKGKGGKKAEKTGEELPHTRLLTSEPGILVGGGKEVKQSCFAGA
jgi:hypothetical protein